MIIELEYITTFSKHIKWESLDVFSRAGKKQQQQKTH